MRYLVWILRVAVFVIVLMFALKNTEPVDVRFFADHVVMNVPLIVVMLVSLIVGGLLGWLIAAPTIMKRRREAARLRREVARLEAKLQEPAESPVAVAPEAIAPMAPL